MKNRIHWMAPIRQYDLWVIALEGGISRWCIVDSFTDEGEDGTVTAEVLTIDDARYTIDRSTIRDGIKALRDSVYHWHWNDLKRGDYDGDTADVIVQLGLFGEIIYA